MKLRNKKTGEIIEVLAKISFIKRNDNFIDSEVNTFDSLAELNEEWEDYEEPKTHWSISQFGGVIDEVDGYMSETIDEMKQIGNYFETKEEAEKAVERLKAFKRLKDLGFRFDGIRWFDTDLHIKTNISTPHPFTKEEVDEFNDCLHKVFGGSDEISQ